MYNWILLYVYWVNGLAFASRCLAKQWYSLYLNIHLYMTWPLVTDDVYVISMHDDISMLIFMIDSPRPKNIVILCTGKVDFGEKCPKNWCCSFVFFYFTDLNVGASSSSDAHNVEKKTDVDFRNSQTIRPMTQPNIISIVADSKKKYFFHFIFHLFVSLDFSELKTILGK